MKIKLYIEKELQKIKRENCVNCEKYVKECSADIVKDGSISKLKEQQKRK